MNALTTPQTPRHSGRTTSINGITGPRKLSGFFVPAVQRSGLLPRHQGHGTTPIFRIGRLRFTSRDKGMVRHATNKGGRLIAVVAAGVCPPPSSAWAAASVRSSSTTRSNCYDP